ncbi:mitochondrial 54S ribosomal protein YmL19 [Homalodisca vitripennis]|nr:mitochondrial 54S ribosomal protein YmL19 [Homalodisca vitripennis]
MKFFLYDPTIQKIEVLRLEKRLDDEILYLRDALPEYCTFPLDMIAEVLPEGSPVPVNTVKVRYFNSLDFSKLSSSFTHYSKLQLFYRPTNK